MLFPRGPDSLNVQDILVKAALKRRDSWASAEEAKRLMLSKTQWRIWEPRVFDRFLVRSIHTPRLSHLYLYLIARIRNTDFGLFIETNLSVPSC